VVGDHCLLIDLSWEGTDWDVLDNRAYKEFTVNGREYRIKLDPVIKDTFQGLHQPVSVDLNFTTAFSTIGYSGSVDLDSIRLVQVDTATDAPIEQDATKDGYLRYEVPCSFTKDPAFLPYTNEVGTLTFSLDGTQGPATSEYHVYFNNRYTTYTGPVLSAEAAGVFQTRFDIQQGGYQIPGWVYVLDGSVTFTGYGNSAMKTYYINLTHAPS
jgi:hypothetical protein